MFVRAVNAVGISVARQRKVGTSAIKTRELIGQTIAENFVRGIPAVDMSVATRVPHVNADAVVALELFRRTGTTDAFIQPVHTVAMSVAREGTVKAPK